MKTKKITEYGMLLGVSLVLAYLESLLPVLIAVPGVKLGLANVITMLLIYNRDIKSTFFFMLARVVLTGLLFSGVSGIIYSFAGGMFCITIMSILKRFSIFSVIGVSIAGALFHNIGQICVACMVIENAHIFYYLPVLCVSGTITGVIVGYVAYILIKNYKRNL